MSGSLEHTKTPLDEALSAQARGGPLKCFVSKIIVPGLLRFGLMAKEDGCAVKISEGRVAVSIEVADGDNQLLNLVFVARMEPDGVTAQAFQRPVGPDKDMHESDLPIPAMDELPEPLTPEVLYDFLCQIYREG